MRALTLTLVSILATLSLTAPAGAQEGHPLKGSWIGTWEGNEVHGDFVLVVLDWDGKAVTGIINPGTDDIAITSVTLDPEDWSVHIEAAAKDREGRDLNYVIDGTIQDLELPNRYITGTWRNGRGRGDFEIRRQ